MQLINLLLLALEGLLGALDDLEPQLEAVGAWGGLQPRPAALRPLSAQMSTPHPLDLNDRQLHTTEKQRRKQKTGEIYGV